MRTNHSAWTRNPSPPNTASISNSASNAIIENAPPSPLRRRWAGAIVLPAASGVVIAQLRPVRVVVGALVLGGVLDVVLGDGDVHGPVLVIDAVDHPGGQHHGLAEDPGTGAHQQPAAPGLDVVLVDLADVTVDGVNRVAADVAGVHELGAVSPDRHVSGHVSTSMSRAPDLFGRALRARTRRSGLPRVSPAGGEP